MRIIEGDPERARKTFPHPANRRTRLDPSWPLSELVTTALLLCFPFQVEDNDDDVIEELLIYRCTSNYYMTWVMSICGLKGVLLIFGVFLAWETRNVHYPSLNDSKNIGLAVYNVFMFSCLALVVEFVVTYPPLKMLVGRSIVLVGTTSTISLLFVPKVRNCRSSCKAIIQSNKTIINSSAFVV